MEYGICGGPEVAWEARKAGFDYFEWSVEGFLQPRKNESAFEESLAAAGAAGLAAPVVNMFMPGDLKIVGPEADMATLEAFVTTVFTRARKAGIGTIVFGSGGARMIPDGFDRSQAWEQMVSFGRMLAPIADGQGVTIALEPLNRGECNFINSVDEGGKLVREIDRPAFRLLCDAYHMLLEGESMESIVRNAELLVHAHLATIPGRRTPGAEDCDLYPFVAALAEGGYEGRLSFEGKLVDPVEELPRAMAVLRELESRVRG